MAKYARFEKDGEVHHGVVEGDTIKLLEGSYLDGINLTSEEVKLDEVKLLSPVEPSKVICVGLNYADHAKESGYEVPDEPCLFMKPSTSVIGPDEFVICPPMSKRVDYEAELGVVIRSTTYNISPEEADEHILGYTCLNDVTARDLQAKDGQWTRSKSFNTFCPIGPWVVDGIDPNSLQIEMYVNGERKQFSNTDQLIFNVQELVSFISRVMTLNAGDVIGTGTPAGIGPVKPGDVMEVRIEKIGTLRNPVR